MTTAMTEIQPTAAAVSTDQRNLATLSHLSGFVLFFGIPSVIGPLVAWLLKRDDAYVGPHAREALNFNLSFMLYGFLAAVSILVLVGIVLLPAVLITWFVLTIAAAIKAANGEHVEYPLTIRFVN